MRFLFRAGAVVWGVLLAVVFSVSQAVAQNYSWDARRLGMGGMTTSGSGNIALESLPARLDQSTYTSIVIPLGLVQVLGNLDTFDPDHPDFDLLRVTDYLGNPWHYTPERSQREGSVDFAKNIIDSGFNRDLNTYRGFTPPEDLLVEGLLAPNWGYTLKFRRQGDAAYQGIYFGAGPYISLQTDLHFDERLAGILGSDSPVEIPRNTTFRITNNSMQQAALAITGGYRAKYALRSSSADRDGIYTAIHVHYLMGFRHDRGGLNLRIDTDAAGLVTAPTLPAGVQLPLQDTTLLPLWLDHQRSTSGRGYAADIGIGYVAGPWEAGLGVNGIANRIRWDDFRRTQYALTSLTENVGFTDCGQPATLNIPGRPPLQGPVLFNCLATAGEIEQELPERYVASFAHHASRWSALMDYNYGFQKSSLHAGGEYRFGPLALRGGARLSREQWHPTGGIGLTAGRIGFDVAYFTNSVNLEDRREGSVALSLRIHSGSSQ